MSDFFDDRRADYRKTESFVKRYWLALSVTAAVIILGLAALALR